MKVSEQVWRELDPELWKEIDGHREPYQAPIRIEQAYAQRLTTWRDGFERFGRGQFEFQIGERSNRQTIKLSFQWGRRGPGSTETFNRWREEIAYIFRNEDEMEYFASTPYIPNTQEFQVWCQFLEIRHYGRPIQAYCVWNGDKIISSVNKPQYREHNYAWTFDWKNIQTLDQMLEQTRKIV